MGVEETLRVVEAVGVTVAVPVLELEDVPVSVDVGVELLLLVLEPVPVGEGVSKFDGEMEAVSVPVSLPDTVGDEEGVLPGESDAVGVMVWEEEIETVELVVGVGVIEPLLVDDGVFVEVGVDVFELEEVGVPVQVTDGVAVAEL